MPANDVISSQLRDRLDAARERLHIEIRWYEPGTPEHKAIAYGRTFGFWIVRIGPDGWQHRPPDPDADLPIALRRRSAINAGPTDAHGHDLEGTMAMALDEADRSWPLGG